MSARDGDRPTEEAAARPGRKGAGSEPSPAAIEGRGWGRHFAGRVALPAEVAGPPRVAIRNGVLEARLQKAQSGSRQEEVRRWR